MIDLSFIQKLLLFSLSIVIIIAVAIPIFNHGKSSGSDSLNNMKSIQSEANNLVKPID